MFRNDFDEFDGVFNQLFANFDALFRDTEKRTKRFGTLPSIQVPGIKLSYDDIRVYSDGEKQVHYKNGIVHREDGPAIQYLNETKPAEYWLEGKQVSQKDIEKLKEDIEEKRIYKAYINNREYTIIGSKKLKEVEALLSNSTQKIEHKPEK